SSGTALAHPPPRRANPSKRLGVASAHASGAAELTRSLLYLSYLFPPRGGAGVQRSLKFAKYLPQFGWQPLIIANGARASDGVTQMQDNSLLLDLPHGDIITSTSDETKIKNKCR